jgi:hypothetical protein
MDAFEEAREAGSRWVRIAGLALLFKGFALAVPGGLREASPGG